ncbi:MAG: beta-propeller fold lactonase family protein [Blastocatellia bacterium]
MLKYFIKTLIVVVFCNIISQAQDNKPLLYQTFVREDVGVDGGQIAIFDATNLSQIRKIIIDKSNITDSNPSRIELSLDKKKAIIANSPFSDSRKGMLIVDLADGRTSKIFDDMAIYEIELAPDGRVWALLDETKELAIIDVNTLKVDKFVLDEAGRDIVFSPNGELAYISLLTKDIKIFNVDSVKSNRTISNLPARNKSQVRRQEMAISRDGNTLFVSGEDSISIVNTTSFITETISLPIRATSFLLKLTPDGKFLYAAGYLGAQFVVINLESREVKTFRTPATTGIQTAVIISPDGRLAYISGFYGISTFDVEKQVFIKNLLTSTGIGFPNPFSLGLTISGDFSIGQAPSLTTISPATSDNIFSNQQVQITWQTTVAPQSYSLASHKVEFSTNGGQSFTVIPGAEELPADARSFTWTVPNIQSANAQIRVSTVDLGARRAASTTGNFAILQVPPIDNIAPTVSFSSPIGGESFSAGNNLNIAWVSSDNVAVTSQDLSLSLDGGQTFPMTIASGLAGSVQSFNFSIPANLATTQARLRLIVRDAAGNTAQSSTASNFTIQAAMDNIAPTVTISQPSSNQRVIAGQPIQVSWASTDNRAVVSQSLLLSLNGGQSFTQVASFGANDSSFVLNNINNINLSFTTPQAIVRITATDQAGNTGQSNSTFIISPMLSMGSYTDKILNISGIGFMANVGQGQAQSLQVFVNDSLVNVAPTSVNNNSITIKGNKKKLGVVKGANNVRVVVNGVMSNSVSFQF